MNLTIWEIVLDALREGAFITGVVIGLMLLVELVDLGSRGKVLEKIRSMKFGGVMIGAVLGVIPGCMGGIATVSLYTSGAVSFGGLIAMLIASSGDEAFVMLSMFPAKAAATFGILFVVGLAIGIAVDLLGRKYDFFRTNQAMLHSHEDFEHIEEEKGLRHLWKHVIVGHLPRVFLWTFSMLLLLGLLGEYVDIESWTKDNAAFMVLLAVLIGFIPESGPHLLFVTLFAGGLVPYNVLLASCISQDGHACLPLLAESKNSFLRAKLINCAIALAAGYLPMLF
ncbi:MAG: arsenic efflux protein [Bacteroidales bacterium]|nr:arsenic efflux protein [Bacteroidales bacterium]